MVHDALVENYFLTRVSYSKITIFITNLMKLNFRLLFFTFYFSMVSYFCFSQKNINQIEADGESLLEKGYDYYRAGNVDSCLYYIEQASFYFKKSKSWEKYITALNDQATICYNLNRINKLKETAFKAYDYSQKYLSPINYNSLSAIRNLDIYYYAIGDYEKSMKFAKKTESLDKSSLGKLERSIFYVNTANTYKFLGDQEKALDYCRKALSIQLDTVPNYYTLSDIYQSIGRIYQSQNQLDSAIYYFEKNHLILKSLKTDELSLEKKVDNFLLLAELWNLTDDKTKSTGSLRKVARLPLNSYNKIQVQEAIGNIAHTNGDYKNAITAYTNAQSRAQKDSTRNTAPIKSRRLIKLANAYNALSNFDAALKTYQEILITLSIGFTNLDINTNPEIDKLYSKKDALIALKGKAETLYQLYSSKGKNIDYLKISNNTYLKAVNIISDIRRGIISHQSKNILAENTVSIYENAIQTTLELYKHTNDLKYLSVAFSLAENNKALLLLESINEQMAKGFSSIPDSLLEKEKDLKVEIAFYEKQLLDKNSLENINDILFNLNQELDQLTSQFEKNYPRYFELKYQNQPIDLETIQDRLAKDNTALIEYFVGEKTIYTFIVTKDDLKIQTVDDPNLVFAAIQQIRPILNEPPGNMAPKEAFKKLTDASFNLYNLILKTALDGLPQDIQYLTIIPDDQLNYIPFDILLRKKADLNRPGYSLDNLQYLLEEYTINYHYSATLLHKSQQRKKQSYEKDFIGFAPSFKDAEYTTNRSCTSDELYSLKCSKDEVSIISDLLSGVSRLEENASKAIFEREASAYRIIHLATHACIDEENANLNKIFLTDDYLSSFDLYNLELKTELAVLSACNTGSGKLIKGEGVMNLARGFINAGCSSTLMSMWSVDDCATSDIMYSFYKNLKGGARKDEALQSAKIAYLKEVSKTKMHPYYWAAFVSFGDMEAIEFKSQSNWLFYFIPAGLLILVVLFFGRGR